MKKEIKDLIPGMILEVDIMYRGAVLINKGSELTPDLIDKIERFGIDHVEIVSEKKNIQNKKNEVEYTVSNELCDKLKESLNKCDVEQVKEATNSMIHTVLKSINLAGDFSNLKYDLQTFENMNTLDHSVRVAIFSVVLARLYNDYIKNYSTDYNPATDSVNIYDVALAALLHDKGRDMNNLGILTQIKKIANDEQLNKKFVGLENVATDKFNEKYIPVYSFCIINKNTKISENVKLMVLYSAETENNTVLLKNTKLDDVVEKSIEIGAKIIHLCSLYDIFLAHFYNTDESFENIITVLGQASSTGIVNEELANLFLMKVPIYPIGAKLILSNGEKAEVIKTFTGYTYTTKPFVKVIKTNQTIDLRFATSITVDRISKNDVLLDEMIYDQVNEANKRK